MSLIKLALSKTKESEEHIKNVKSQPIDYVSHRQLVYDNRVQDSAIHLTKAGRKDAIMKTQQTTLEQVVKGGTN